MSVVLYLGNKLSQHGFTPTSVETLGVRLGNHFIMKRGSSVRNPILRLLHMLGLVIRHRKADVLLIDTYSTWAFWYAIITAQLARLLRLPYIPILHGGNLPERAKKSPFWTRLLLKNANKIVCPSGYLKHYMHEFYPRNYELIPNYLDFEHYPFRERKVSEKVRLLWVRSFHQIYNPKLAVDIVCKLKNSGIDVTLAMVGPDKDGSLKLTQQYALDRNVMDYIDFTGRLTKPEWIAKSNDYDIFINTTNVDNTPVSVMEAMALGMIVISTNVGGMPFLFEDGKEGLLVPPNNPEVFVEAILRLQENDEYATKLSHDARKKAENFSWKKIKHQWEQILR